jgi:hypothetical protein
MDDGDQPQLVPRFGHAAYLGRELARSEQALTSGEFTFAVLHGKLPASGTVVAPSLATDD